ncbi:hypothetical protein B7463_g12303, partial [Scytalidium lignicola]
MMDNPTTAGQEAVGNGLNNEDVWDEQRLEDALKTLNEMYIQVRGLRTTITRLIAPLTSKQPSPEALFRGFSKSAVSANQEVQQFRRLMSDEESQRILEHAKQSRAANPDGIKPWLVTDHSDWLKRGK